MLSPLRMSTGKCDRSICLNMYEDRMKAKRTCMHGNFLPPRGFHLLPIVLFQAPWTGTGIARTRPLAAHVDSWVARGRPFKVFHIHHRNIDLRIQATRQNAALTHSCQPCLHVRNAIFMRNWRPTPGCVTRTACGSPRLARLNIRAQTELGQDQKRLHL